MGLPQMTSDALVSSSGGGTFEGVLHTTHIIVGWVELLLEGLVVGTKVIESGSIFKAVNTP